MKKIILSLLLFLPLCVKAQTAFTVTTDGKQYSFPTTSEITLTDNELWTPDTITKEVHDTVGTLYNAGWIQVKFIVKDIIEDGKFGSTDNGKLATLVGDSLWQVDFTVNDPSVMSFALERKMRKANGITTLDDYGASEENEQKIGQAEMDCYFAMTTFAAGKWRIYLNEATLQYAFVKLNDNGTPDFSSMAEQSAEPEAESVVISFDEEGWSDLIDSKQYGGPLLYGETGYGFTEDKDVYEWTELRTTLHSKISNSYGSWAYWNGGVAISNYHDSITVGSYTNQLSIPLDLQAHSGDNFAVAYGNTTLDFSDGEAREVKGLWVTNNCYFLNSLNYGDAFNTAATATTYVDVVFEGFDANGTSTGKVTKRLQNGKVSLMGWAYVDLSPLGSIASFSISYEASDDQKGDYGINAPQYVAIDDIEISL